MRHDMVKVVCEPARNGVGYYRTLPNEYRKAKHFKLIDAEFAQDGDGGEEIFTVDVIDEFCARVLPMRSKHIGWDGKEHNFNSKVIKSFLMSRRGQKWDDVYSEFCQVFKSGGRGNHSGYVCGRKLLGWHIEVNTYIGDDGRVYYRSNYGRVEHCVEEEFNSLYVDPRDGTIKLTERGESYRTRCKRNAAKRKAEREKSRVIVNKKLQLHKINNAWYRVYVGAVPAEMYESKYWVRDILGNIEISHYWNNLNQQLIARYGDVVWGYRKEAASKRDIRRYNLS